MKEKIFIYGILLNIFAAASSSNAQDKYEEQVLFSKDAWQVEVTHDTSDGQLWCSAATTNRQGQSFDVTAYDDGGISLFVFDHDWSISPRDVRFLIDVDRERWVLDGRGDGIAISLSMREKEESIRFLSEIMEGNSVVVRNADKHHLGSFSLSGSYAAITKLFECWGRIKSNTRITEADPFVTSSDPF